MNNYINNDMNGNKNSDCFYLEVKDDIEKGIQTIILKRNEIDELNKKKNNLENQIIELEKSIKELELKFNNENEKIQKEKEGLEKEKTKFIEAKSKKEEDIKKERIKLELDVESFENVKKAILEKNIYNKKNFSDYVRIVKCIKININKLSKQKENEVEKEKNKEQNNNGNNSLSEKEDENKKENNNNEEKYNDVISNPKRFRKFRIKLLTEFIITMFFLYSRIKKIFCGRKRIWIF